MGTNDYYIFPEEKLAIKKILEDNKLKYLNFVIDDLANNLRLGNFEKDIWEYYKQTEEVLEYFSKLYLAIFKDELNNKHKLEKVYIPMSLKEFDAFASNKEYLGLLVGTKDQFVAKTKDYDIDDLVIIEAELKNIPAYITKEEINILETVILAPPYTIEQTDKIEEIEGRTFVKFKFSNITYPSQKKISDSILKAIVSRASEQSDNLKKYYDKEKENHIYTINLNNAKRELLEIQKKQEELKNDTDVTTIKNREIEKIELTEKIEELGKEIEKDIEGFNKNQDEMETALQVIELWKKDIKEYLKKIFADAIMEIELERTKIKKAENLTKEEKEFFVELQKALKSNKEEAEKILKRSEELIKIEQKFAKIAADCGAKYLAVADGFKIREAALELFSLMDNIYKDFEDYYITLTSDGKRNEVKEIRYKKILDNDNQIGILINYFNNAKSAKPGTSIDRFDELALIEENELKRQITDYVLTNIAKGHIDILDREIEEIDTRSPMQKILTFLSGKREIEEFKIYEAEYKIEKIEEELAKELSIEQNYSIHEILAYITMFKDENMDDQEEYIQNIIKKLAIVENTIQYNFSIDIDKVAELILEKSYKNLPIGKDARKMKDLQRIEYETDAFLKQYGYDTINDIISKKYPDTVAKEIKKIVDYAKVAF